MPNFGLTPTGVSSESLGVPADSQSLEARRDSLGNVPSPVSVNRRLTDHGSPFGVTKRERFTGPVSSGLAVQRGVSGVGSTTSGVPSEKFLQCDEFHTKRVVETKGTLEQSLQERSGRVWVFRN